MGNESEKVFEYISYIDEIENISEILDELDVTEALNDIVKIVYKSGEIPFNKVDPIMVKLQATAALCHLRATYYTSVMKGSAGTINNQKKNLYFSLSKSLDDLVAALKYLSRPGGRY